MGKELYVGHLSYDTTEYDLDKLFSVSGTVTSIHLITDAKSGEFKGCGYVRMSSEAEAKDAIASLDGALLIDRPITVSMANPQKQNQPGGYKGKSGFKPAGSAARRFGSKPAAPKSPSSKPGPRPAGAKPGGARSGGPRRSGK